MTIHGFVNDLAHSFQFGRLAYGLVCPYRPRKLSKVSTEGRHRDDRQMGKFII
jgi:hypothetical protein